MFFLSTPAFFSLANASSVCGCCKALSFARIQKRKGAFEPRTTAVCNHVSRIDFMRPRCLSQAVSLSKLAYEPVRVLFGFKRVINMANRLRLNQFWNYLLIFLSGRLELSIFTKTNKPKHLYTYYIIILLYHYN